MMITIRKTIKKHATQWLGAAILAALAFGILYSPGMRRSPAEHAWLLSVNNEKIGFSEFQRRFSNLQKQIALIRSRYGQFAESILQAQGLATHPEERVQQSLVQETLLNQAARKAGLQFNTSYTMGSMAYVQQELFEALPMDIFDSQGGLNVRLVHNWLAKQGLHEEYLARIVNDAFARNLLYDFAARSVYIPENILKQKAILASAARSFSVLRFSLNELLAKERATAISDAELLAFYNEENTRAHRYWVPEKRSALLWRFEPKGYGISVSDAEINEYYRDNKSQRYISEPAQVQVRHILFEVPVEADRQSVFEKAQSVRSAALAEPDQFASLAKEHSSDTESAENGGLLPFFARGEKERAFDKAAFTLRANKDISQVIETEKGFEVVQRIAKRNPVFKQLPTVRAEIEKTLLEQKFNELFTSTARELVDAHSQKSSALEPFAHEKKGIKTALSKIGRSNEEWGRQLFALERGDISFFIDKEAGYILQPTEVFEQHLPPMGKIKEQVKEDLYQYRAAKSLELLLQQAKDKARTMSLARVQKELGGKLEEIRSIKPEDKEKTAALEKNGLSAQKLFQIEIVGGLLKEQTAGEGVLVRLDTELSLSDEELSAAIITHKTEIEREFLGLYVRGFIASLARHATIKTNEFITNNVDEQDVASEE